MAGKRTGSLSRRYARALVQLAQQEKTLENFGVSLQAFLSLFQKSPKVLETLANDRISQKERLLALNEISDKAKVHPLFKNFLLLLLKKERINLLAEIGREYQRFEDAVLGIVRVDVVTPAAPEAGLLDRIEQILQKELKKKVILKSETDEDILGGVVLRIDHTRYDGSIRRRLQKIREEMINA